MLGKLFAPLAMKISAGLIAALLLALGFTMWRADTFSDRSVKLATSLSDEKKAHAQDVANERAAHAVTRASLANLEQHMAGYIAAGQRRVRAAERALERQESHSAALGEQIARIRAERPEPAAVERCESPSAVMQAEGL